MQGFLTDALAHGMAVQHPDVALSVRQRRSFRQAPHLSLACAYSPYKLCHLAGRPAAAQQTVQPAAGA